MKKSLMIVGNLLFALSLSFGSLHAAQSDGNLGLTFEGNSGDFITYEDGEAYTNMAPGENRTQRITLTNDDQREMKFYVRAEYTNPLGEGTSTGAIAYDISFANNGEVFYDAKMGGVTKANMNSLEQNYLLKTLERGESTTVDMSILIDGDSMDNTYQNAQGNLNLIFSVEYEEDTIVEKVVTTIKKVPVINQIIDTGDTTTIGLLLGGFGASLVIIVILVVGKLKKRKEQ